VGKVEKSSTKCSNSLNNKRVGTVREVNASCGYNNAKQSTSFSLRLRLHYKAAFVCGVMSFSMRSLLLTIGFLTSILLSMYLGYREGIKDGYTYTQVRSDFEDATGQLRSAQESASNSYAWYTKLTESESMDDIKNLAERERQFSLYNIEQFRIQAKRLRDANIKYPLVEIYEPIVWEMEQELLK